ncbi:unnamed protein product [Microthlaspi erraticum]|uniref:Flavin-containing monooxygenase n=1 Tax=Microthlaspi erraticum TaxID=1685480 RepID=A0A6D2JAA7_9BRAS|nr:unnamed protein product [Microthlaspi erraticum]CAA7023899.1 unnamed protein product [Microthlaspi erraticum]CAA7034247.1 unnamed protein product [Microthlaspi erraticum]CAA7041591.1 unnamed protein product [Microthlaspi erraticum]CAA7041597.1 unnamed protein product [Microthlaspi erraticum]
MAPSIKSRHVAVIRAGAAGLVAARELRREGHSVVVFERQKETSHSWSDPANPEFRGGSRVTRRGSPSPGYHVRLSPLPFPMFELQSKWIAGVLSRRIMLPSKEDMLMEIETLYARLEGEGVPKRYTHSLGINHFEYNDWLASEYGCSGTEEYRKEMFLMSFMRKMENPETYRDEWEDHHHLVAQANHDFSLYIVK